MNELEKKFYEYFYGADFDCNKVAHDLTEIADKDYEEKLIKADHNIHRMPHKFKHHELFYQEIEQLQKENTELKKQITGMAKHIDELEHDIAIPTREKIIKVLNQNLLSLRRIRFYGDDVKRVLEQIASEILEDKEE